jgi:hypothetical protein
MTDVEKSSNASKFTLQLVRVNTDYFFYYKWPLKPLGNASTSIRDWLTFDWPDLLPDAAI